MLYCNSGIKVLEISATMMGRVERIHPTLIWDNDSVILVDTGYPGQLPLIREAIANANVSFHRLNKIIITHQDLDHIGGLPAIVSELSHHVEVISSETEKPFIQGEQPLLKLTPETIARAMESLPAEVPEQWRQAFKATLEHPPKGHVDKVINDGDILPCCGGIEIISTPGHTPGHVSLYHQASKTLIAADAMTVMDGQLMGPDPAYTLDMGLAQKSLKRLTRYDIENVVCYHGGAFNGNVNQRILELMNM